MADFVLDETKRVDEKRSVRVLAIELVVLEGPSRGERTKLGDGIARVGTAEGCHLRIMDPTVSRVHCELTVRSDVVTIKDCGSTNGTTIEGVRIREADVVVGALVRVGTSAFRIEAREDPLFVPISDRAEFGELVGASLEMRSLYAVLERVAQTGATLLISGETGTGKDVAARSVHTASKRTGPFVPIDCGAIPENLIESELFGHVRGAFTGAVNQRAGVFEEAAGGTLFLDEIGEMPLSMQPKLLRAIESRSIRRVGSSTAVPVDVRIIAATNRSLARCVNEGTFREDLYYRLAVVEVKLPMLRARRDDIPLLAQRFYDLYTGGGAAPLDREYTDALKSRAWPGNVRELRNFIERAVALGQARSSEGPTTIRGATPVDSVLPPGLEAIVPLHLPLKEARDAWTSEFESIYVRTMLKKTNGNLTRAAELAGVSRRFMQRLLVRLGIRASEIADADDDE